MVKKDRDKTSGVGQYQLGFITDAAIYAHVAETVAKYRFNIDLQLFNKNLLDPIKLTFDAKIYI